MSTIASNALREFNTSISQYGNIEDSVDNYVSSKRNELYENWKSGVLSSLNIDQEKKQQMDELIGLGAAVPGAVRGGYKAYKAYQAKKKGGGETEDDTTGADSTAADKGADKEGEKDDAQDNDVQDETNTTSSSQPPVEDDESKTSEPTEEPSGEVEMTEQPSLLQSEDTPAPKRVTFGGGEETPNSEFAASKTPTQQTLQKSDLTKPERSPIEESTKAEGADAAEDAEDATKIGTDIAAGEGEEAGAGALAALGDAAGLAADVLGPVGLVAGIGYSLFEMFHHDSKKNQKAPTSVTNPYIQTAFNTAGNIVLPSESSMIDNIGGHSAF